MLTDATDVEKDTTNVDFCIQKAKYRRFSSTNVETEFDKMSYSHSELLLIIRPGGVEGSDGVVARHPVFGHQGGHISIGVLVEEAVVSYAQADDYIQLSFRLIQ